MTITIALIIGLLLSLSLFIAPKKPVLLLSVIYWLTLLTDGAAIPIFSNPTITWLSIGAPIQIHYYTDGLSTLFTTMITGIGAIILWYGYCYYSDDAGKRGKLLSLLQLFAVAMYALVRLDNFITLYTAWEITTVSSYLLIQFNRHDVTANRNALNGILITTLGGLAMLIGFILLMLTSHTMSIPGNIMYFSQHTHASLLTISFILVLAGAMSKSAQFPCMFWLRGAMSAPTPVSAYLHSATMVNAGIYLLARLHPLFSNLPIWSPILTSIGMLTMVISGITSLAQTDLKRLLAETTLFALGSMVILLSGKMPLKIEAFVLLFIYHALYKASAFMLVGVIDHRLHTRDLNKLHGVGRQYPLIGLGCLIAFLSMAGLPPLFGFTLKQILFSAKLTMTDILSLKMLISLFASACITATSLHALWIMFQKPKKYTASIAIDPMIWPPLLTCFFTVAFAFSIQWLAPFTTMTSKNILQLQQTILQNPNSVASVSLSIGMIALGLILAASIRWLNMARYKLPSPLTTQHQFEQLLNGSLHLGQQITKLLGKSNRLQMLICLVAVASFMLLLNPANFFTHIPKHYLNHSGAMLFITFTIICACISLFISDRFIHNLISLSIIGLAMGFFYIYRHAIDVAIAQILTDILTMIMVFFAIYPFRKRLNVINTRRTWLPIQLSIGSIFGLITWYLLQFIHPKMATQTASQYFIQHSQPHGYGLNIVNVILVDFRALDTMGEILVVFITALAVRLMLHTMKKGESP